MASAKDKAIDAAMAALAQEAKTTARNLDAADGKVDGIIHPQAAAKYLSAQIPQLIAEGRKNHDVNKIAEALATQRVRDSLELDPRESYKRKTDVQIDQAMRELGAMQKYLEHADPSPDSMAPSRTPNTKVPRTIV